MVNKKQSEGEDILERVKQLREKTQTGENKKTVPNKIPLISPFLGFIKTLLSPVWKPLAFIFNHFKSLISWMAYGQDKQGSKRFSSKRFITRGMLVALGFLLVHVVFSALYFYGTQFEELVYTTGKQEIINGEEYQFTGCTSLPCSTIADNGKYYKITSSLYFPYLIYPEENVYANIPLQDGACHVKGYGIYFRRARFFIKRFQWWQKAYSVQCRPYTEEEKNRAINSGVINTNIEN